MAPVHILGAGPAGLTAARTLAKAGLAVTVHERRSHCGARFNGDLQGIENWSTASDVLDVLAGIDINLQPHLRPVRTMRLATRRGIREIHLERPGFYLVPRGRESSSLDSVLRDLALESGVNIRFKSSRLPQQVDIVATGPSLPQYWAIVKGLVFKTTASDQVVALLGDAFAPGGYAYLLISEGRGCVASVLFRRFWDARLCLEKTIAFVDETLHISITEPRPMGGTGNFFFPPACQLGGSIAVGEAAGIQDLLWGFGIRTAIESGYLAARCLLSGESYTGLAKRRFEPCQKASMVNRLLWTLGSRFDYRLVEYGLRRYNLRLMRVASRFTALHRALWPLAKTLPSKENSVARAKPRIVR